MTKSLRRFLGQPLAFGALVMICLGIACNGQVLPQLLACIFSLDSDHHVVVHASSCGIDVVLTHNGCAVPRDAHRSVGSRSSESAHIIHVSRSTTLAYQTAVAERNTEQQIAAHIAAALPTPVDVFAPKTILAYSRPPPDEISIPPVHRSTLLLI